MATETLECAAGHTWEREIRKGKKPTRCPDHKNGKPATTPKDEEAQAKKKARALEKTHAARDEAAATRRKSALENAIAETAKAHPSCTCGLTPKTTLTELRNLGMGCCNPRFCCPRLDAIRRRLGS